MPLRTEGDYDIEKIHFRSVKISTANLVRDTASGILIALSENAKKTEN
jgi:hypothetical protein